MMRGAAPVRLRLMGPDPITHVFLSVTAFATSIAAAIFALEVVLVLYQRFG